jgi:hypothetical protein
MNVEVYFCLLTQEDYYSLPCLIFISSYQFPCNFESTKITPVTPNSNGILLIASQLLNCCKALCDNHQHTFLL